MTGCYRISEFAQLCGVTPKTLRFYDEIGLFKPSAIDPRTRYRFYGAAQLDQLAAVLALRDLGVPLADIRRSISRAATPERQQDLLNELKVTLERSIRHSTQSLGLVNAALDELKGAQRRFSVVLKRQPALLVASVRSTVKTYDEVERFESELRNALPTQAVGSVRGAVWHRCADASVLEGEAFVSLKQRVASRRGYQVTQLPAATLACAYSKTDDDSAAKTYDGLRKWMEVRGYCLAGPKREIYLDQILEIQYPLKADNRRAEHHSFGRGSYPSFP